jgi:hypothetical protein
MPPAALRGYRRLGGAARDSLLGRVVCETNTAEQDSSFRPLHFHGNQETTVNHINDDSRLIPTRAGASLCATTTTGEAPLGISYTWNGPKGRKKAADLEQRGPDGAATHDQARLRDHMVLHENQMQALMRISSSEAASGPVQFSAAFEESALTKWSNRRSTYCSDASSVSWPPS